MSPRVPFSQIVMGINSRNARLLKVYNEPESIRRVNSKLKFKNLLLRHDILVPETYDVVESQRALEKIPWEQLEGRSMVIKPDRGFGGNGILVLPWNKRRRLWMRNNRTLDRSTVLRHVRDILDGQHSRDGLSDRAFFEEMIVAHSFFRKLTLQGLSDIRVIVFNGVPLMAMIRIPTAESSGRANLHAGGIGIGVDIGSGTTFAALYHGHYITSHPESNVSLIGLTVPKWSELLELAIETQRVSGLGYTGVDLVIDNSGRPLVLEANAAPGLAIQLANLAGLRERVARVRNLKVRSVDHGVRVATELFSEIGEDKRRKKRRSRAVLPRVVPVRIIHPTNAQFVRVEAKVDTGADSTSIDFSVAEKIGYKRLVRQLKKVHIFDTMTRRQAQKLIKSQRAALWFKTLDEDIELWIVKSSSGVTVRVMVPIRLVLQKKIIVTKASIVNRSFLNYDAIIGSADLTGFYVDPHLA